MINCRDLHDRLTVVILTHNRKAELLRTLTEMAALPENPEIIVVDNASIDATDVAVRDHFPKVRLVRLGRNIGAAARNIGVQKARTPYVAFCDDDTWWAPGALLIASDLLDAYARVALVTARVLIGPQAQEDPACRAMAASPLPAEGLPGPALLGFLAGACVVRRAAFIEAGGYEPHFFIGGEEALLTLDLASFGWHVVYARQLTVHHYPSALRDTAVRQHSIIRNAFWVAWMRLPLLAAARDTVRIWRQFGDWRAALAGFASALRGLPWVIAKRRVMPDDVQALYRMLHW